MQNPTTSHNCHSNTCPNSRTNSLRPSQFFAQLSAMSAVGEEDENSQLRRTQSEKTNADTPSFEISHSKTCPPMHTVDENEEHNNAEQNEYQKSEVRMLENIFQGGNENEEDHTKEDSGYSLTDDSTKGGTKEYVYYRLKLGMMRRCQTFGQPRQPGLKNTLHNYFTELIFYVF